MNDRPNDLLRIRPQISKTIDYPNMGAEERFQNATLRPILKLQNPLLLAVFRNYIEKHKGVFYELGSKSGWPTLKMQSIRIKNSAIR